MKNFNKVSQQTTVDEIPVATLVSDTEALPHQQQQPTAPSHQYDNPSSSSASMNLPPNQRVGVPIDPTFTRFPMPLMSCPNCNQESRTKIRTAPAWETWVAVVVLFFLFWPACWLPLVMDNCKKTQHFCVSCGAEVGTVSAFHDCCVNYQGWKKEEKKMEEKKKGKKEGETYCIYKFSLVKRGHLDCILVMYI